MAQPLPHPGEFPPPPAWLGLLATATQGAASDSGTAGAWDGEVGCLLAFLDDLPVELVLFGTRGSEFAKGHVLSPRVALRGLGRDIHLGGQE